MIRLICIHSLTWTDPGKACVMCSCMTTLNNLLLSVFSVCLSLPWNTHTPMLIIARSPLQPTGMCPSFICAVANSSTTWVAVDISLGCVCLSWQHWSRYIMFWKEKRERDREKDSLMERVQYILALPADNKVVTPVEKKQFPWCLALAGQYVWCMMWCMECEAWMWRLVDWEQQCGGICKNK